MAENSLEHFWLTIRSYKSPSYSSSREGECLTLSENPSPQPTLSHHLSTPSTRTDYCPEEWRWALSSSPPWDTKVRFHFEDQTVPYRDDKNESWTELLRGIKNLLQRSKDRSTRKAWSPVCDYRKILRIEKSLSSATPPTRICRGIHEHTHMQAKNTVLLKSWTLIDTHCAATKCVQWRTHRTT